MHDIFYRALGEVVSNRMKEKLQKAGFKEEKLVNSVIEKCKSSFSTPDKWLANECSVLETFS